MFGVIITYNYTALCSLLNSIPTNIEDGVGWYLIVSNQVKKDIIIIDHVDGRLMVGRIYSNSRYEIFRHIIYVKIEQFDKYSLYSLHY